MTNNDDGARNECDVVRSVTKEVFQGYDYLGVTFSIYDPGDVTPPGTDHSAEEVYVTDYHSTVDADIVVFHVNAPSLGVGMEAQIVAYATIPRVVICKQGAPVSRMFRGVFGPTIATIEYPSLVDFRELLEDKMSTIAVSAIESAERRRPVAEEFASQHPGRKILKQRVLQGMTIQELAKRTDIEEYWLRRLERDPKFASTYSLMQLARIDDTLQCSTSLDGRQVKVRSEAEENLDSDQKMSLDHLITFVCNREIDASDDKVFRIWNAYLEQQAEELQEAGQYRQSEGEDNVVTSEDWKRRYDEIGLF